MRKRDYLKIVREVACIKDMCSNSYLSFFPCHYFFLKIHSKIQTIYTRVMLLLTYYYMDEM